MLNYIEYLGVPFKVAFTLAVVFFGMQVIGELLEFKGKVVPEIFKIRKYFSRRKAEKNETAQTLKEVKQLLSDVNSHYSNDNITKRNEWMQKVNERGAQYDESIQKITENLNDVTQALKDNTRLTEEMFIQSSRDRIIDFATKVAGEEVSVSREEFNRIFKVYTKYETFLENRGLTNGEIDVAYRIIMESYEQHMRHHTFIEDRRGYTSE